LNLSQRRRERGGKDEEYELPVNIVDIEISILPTNKDKSRLISSEAV
jgi:hypothetical protein